MCDPRGSRRPPVATPRAAPACICDLRCKVGVKASATQTSGLAAHACAAVPAREAAGASDRRAPRHTGVSWEVCDLGGYPASASGEGLITMSSPPGGPGVGGSDHSRCRYGRNMSRSMPMSEASSEQHTASLQVRWPTRHALTGAKGLPEHRVMAQNGPQTDTVSTATHCCACSRAGRRCDGS